MNRCDKYKKILNQFIDDDEEKYNFLTKFKRGGISHANQMGWHREGVAVVLTLKVSIPQR